jgi:hypothetical protein
MPFAVKINKKQIFQAVSLMLFQPEASPQEKRKPYDEVFSPRDPFGRHVNLFEDANFMTKTLNRGSKRREFMISLAH